MKKLFLPFCVLILIPAIYVPLCFAAPSPPTNLKLLGGASEFGFQWTANHTNDEVDFYRIYWSRNYGEYDDPASNDPPPRMLIVDDGGGEGVKYGAVYDETIDNIIYDIPEITVDGVDSIACFTVTGVDVNGYESDYSNQVCRGPVIPPFVVTEANQSSYTLSGWAYPDAIVYVYLHNPSGTDYQVGLTTADQYGAWTMTIDFSELPEGTVTLYASSNGTVGPYATGTKDSATSKFTAGPGSTGITETSATIAWSTNENTRTVLEYRTADQSLPPEEQISEQLSDGILKVDHSMQINSLTPSRAYYYRVRATDAAGHELISNEKAFKTLESADDVPPIVTQPSDDGNPSETGATISWYVNEWCTSDLQCRVDDGSSPYISREIDEGEGDRTVDIGGLTPGERYICRVLATDASGNGPVISQESDPFTTRIDNMDPVIDESTINVTVEDRSATITWQTDENANSVVEYWTAGSAVQSEPLVPANTVSQNHLVILVALNESTFYNFRVISTDDATNPNTAYSSVKSFTTLATPDTTAPAFDELPTVNVIDNTATISWVSNEETTGSVQYRDATSSSWDNSKDDIVLKTVHSVNLTGLDKGKQYYYRVGITDGSENGPVVSNEYGFFIEADADITEPQFVQYPTVINVTSDTAALQWSTDENSTSLARYGKTSEGPYADWDSYPLIFNSAILTRDHLVTLTHLDPGTKYVIMVGSTDIWTNGPAKSYELSFTTDPVVDGESPRVTKPPTVTGITSRSATVYWETDEPANGEVRYGTSKTTWENYPPNNVVINSQTGTNHTVILNNLDIQTRYYFSVGSTDAAGNGPETNLQDNPDETNNPFSEDVFTTLVEPDVTAPRIIDGPGVAAVDAISAIITWETDEPSNSLVQYDISSETLLTLSASDGDMVTQHNVTLTGLNPTTTYNYFVGSLDGSGNGPTISAGNSFTTATTVDTSAPVISNMKMTFATDTTALITWNTDEPANSLVRYGTVSSATWDGYAYAEGDADMLTEHSTTITNLQPGTQYVFRIGSQDAKGNGPTYNANPTNPSVEGGFTTTVFPDTEAPQVAPDSVIISVNVADRTAVVTWETQDEPGNSQVQYDIKSQGWGGYDFAENEAEMVYTHSVTLTNLLLDTIYFVRVSSVDASGNNYNTSYNDKNPSEEYNFILDQTELDPEREREPIEELGGGGGGGCFIGSLF